MAAFDVLREFFQARGTFTDAELAIAESLFVPRTFKAATSCSARATCRNSSRLLQKACLRSYSIDDKGNEHIVQFAAETYWLGDSASLTTGAPSQFFIQALEDSDLLLIDRARARKRHERSRLCRRFSHGRSQARGREGSPHRVGVERVGRGTLPRLHEHVSLHCGAGAAMDAARRTSASRRKR